MTKKQNFFVGLNDPVLLRRNLLNSSKGIIDSLKRYERYEIINDSKFDYIRELKIVMDEIVVLNKKLRNHLPKESVVKKTHQIVKNPRIKKSKDTHSNQTKLDVLESELSKIESKLDALE